YLKNKFGKDSDNLENQSKDKSRDSDSSSLCSPSKSSHIPLPEEEAAGKSYYDLVIKGHEENLKIVQDKLIHETESYPFILDLRKGLDELDLLRSGKLNKEGFPKADIDFIIDTLSKLEVYLYY